MIFSKLLLENFKPKSWELKPFDLTKINNIVEIHPFQYIMRALYKYYPHFDDEGKLIDKFMNEDWELIDEYPDEKKKKKKKKFRSLDFNYR